MSEFLEFTKQYPWISFNDYPYQRGHGLDLFQLEAYNICPNNYELGVVTQYRKVYTWNRKNQQFLKSKGIDTILTNGFPLFDNYYFLDEFIPYDQKIKGTCLLCRHRPRSLIIFDITHRRLQTLLELQGMETHCYGRVPYGGDHYRGMVGNGEPETYPSSYQKFKLVNKYMFDLCFENCYHERWSFDYITEKIFDALKSKTIPIYWGCYNIEDHIPEKFFVDFRRFTTVAQLSEYLLSIDENKYIERTEEAYNWVLNCKYGSIQYLKSILECNK